MLKIHFFPMPPNLTHIKCCVSKAEQIRMGCSQRMNILNIQEPGLGVKYFLRDYYYKDKKQ